ncbi:maleylpyruvate isomerase N-terminal domain-containing protein [Cellulomonas sp. RIT-PI-Y]|uniref:maleylpyruvate isomerase N-terminal domain-containing protein n=1 Tax=Cellulomonas sp. RIT-PI-Y TaxID=3035297 RepID=UPI0021DB2772|nr:maleylpyruvate isomerase N-terminal domain-containing protein [Cellulomonas sp. RIT-PI-Y]
MRLRPEDLAARIDLLERQWDTLRDWVGTAVTVRDRGAASVLDGWTVAELVAHLGRAMDALAVCEPAADGTVPATLAEYLGGYAGRAADIAGVTRELAEQIADDPLGHVDARARAALARARELGPDDRVVQARRAPVLLSTMLASRITELVVHADDLQRSLARSRGAAPGSRAELGDGIGPRPGVPGGLGPIGELGDGVASGGPIDGDALDLVSSELLRIVVARGGWDLDVVQPLTWVRLAAGRLPYDVDVLAAALAPRFTSDAVPDLGRMLPVL